jgi:hypothetical protein
MFGTETATVTLLSVDEHRSDSVTPDRPLSGTNDDTVSVGAMNTDLGQVHISFGIKTHPEVRKSGIEPPGPHFGTGQLAGKTTDTTIEMSNDNGTHGFPSHRKNIPPSKQEQ